MSAESSVRLESDPSSRFSRTYVVIFGFNSCHVVARPQATRRVVQSPRPGQPFGDENRADRVRRLIRRSATITAARADRLSPTSLQLFRTTMAAAQILALLVEDDDAYAAMMEAGAGLLALGVRSRSTARAALPRRVSTSPEARVRRRPARPRAARQLRSRDLRTAAAGRRRIADRRPDLERRRSAWRSAAVQPGAQDYLVKSSTDAQLLARSLRYACERVAAPPHPARARSPLPRARRPQPRRDHADRSSTSSRSTTAAPSRR